MLLLLFSRTEAQRLSNLPKIIQLANGRAGGSHAFIYARTHSFTQQICEQPLKCQALGWQLNRKANLRKGPILGELRFGEVILLSLLCLSRRGGYGSEMLPPTFPCRCLGQNPPTDTRVGPYDPVRGHVEDQLLPTTTVLPTSSAPSRSVAPGHRCFKLKLKYGN